MNALPARLSAMRTVVLAGFAVVWFTEMTLWGLRPLSELWTGFWEMPSPGDPQLATALYLTHAIEAAGKGALGVLAVYALRSRSALVRTALFIPMALVPPLNLAFPFRTQGFPLVPTLIGATLSVILCETLFLFKDRSAQRGPSDKVDPESRAAEPGWLERGWFAANAVLLTLAAGLFVLAPDTAVRLALPCFAVPFGIVRTDPGVLTIAGMTVGTHLAAVATATWIGAAYARRNVTVRRAVAAANTLLAVAMCALPLVHLARYAGAHCALASPLLYAVPLLAGWLVYAAFSYGGTKP